MLTVTFYTKPNCPLCDDALEQIELAQREEPFELVEVNILADPDIYLQHRHNIPVVCLEGVEVFRYRLTAEELIARVRERRRGRPAGLGCDY
ncbi:MAG: glutaredoxin family protein [Verrucomicrobiota bacterium]